MTVQSVSSSEVVLTIRLPADLHDRLVKIAGKNDRPKSAEARKAIREYVDRMEEAA
jgi:predicted transcriptional regulator